MSENISLLKGKVIVQDKFTAQEEEILTTKYKSKKVFEFWRTTHKSLSFLQELKSMEDLSLMNTKITDAADLSSITNLKRLFLNGGKFSSGMEFLADLKQIEELHLLNFKGPLIIPSLKGLDLLKKFRVWDCKGFSDVSVLQDVNQLEEVELVVTALSPKDLLPLFKKKSVKYIGAQFKTKKDNDLFSDYLVKFNKKKYR